MAGVIGLILLFTDCLAYTSTTTEQINKASTVLEWGISGLLDDVCHICIYGTVGQPFPSQNNTVAKLWPLYSY